MNPSDRNGPHNMWEGLIFLSDGTVPRNIGLLESMHFETVIDLSGGQTYNIPKKCKYVRYEIDDTCSADIIPVVGEASEIIDGCVQNQQRILVHCAMGASRSATVVIFWLMTRQHMSLRVALNHCKRKRHAVRPNNGFFLKLREFEKKELRKPDSMPLDEVAYTVWCLKHPTGEESPSCLVC
jgi:hypothetical protein